MKKKQFLIGFLAVIALTVTLYFVLKKPVTEEVYQELNDVTFIELDEETILKSGFINDIGVSQVIQNCTQCHSSKLVTQNRLNKTGWEASIKWMQETQNLWDLGKNEERIVNYLAKNYAPETEGRRTNIEVAEWYELE